MSQSVSTLKGRAPASREKRLDTLSAYLGQPAGLEQEFQSEEIDQRIRTFTQSAPDDLYTALQVIASIPDAVTVVHGPRGCAASFLQTLSRGRERVRGAGRWVVTNLDQRETIMGADGKLRAAVASVYRRYKPEVVLVVATPSVAINNDDIQSAVNEVSEELGATIIPVFASGFSSKAAVQGHDLASYSLLKALLRGRQSVPASEQVNLLSTTELKQDREEAKRLLQGLGLEVRTFPAGDGLDGLKEATAARISVPLNFDTSGYLGKTLQDLAGVPLLSLPRPIGLSATRKWLVGVGAAAGKESEAQELYEREAASLARLSDAAPLRGLKVYLSLEPATTFGVAEAIEELGGGVAGISLHHLDRTHLEALRELKQRLPDLPLHVGNSQGFEEINLLQRARPDLYIGDGCHLPQIAHLGVPTVSLSRVPVVGYTGLASLAHELSRAVRNPSFVRQLASERAPYASQWLQRSANWHIKQEVK